MHIVRAGERHINCEYVIYTEPIGPDGALLVVVEGGTSLEIPADAGPAFRLHLDEVSAETMIKREIGTTITRRATPASRQPAQRRKSAPESAGT